MSSAVIPWADLPGQSMVDTPEQCRLGVSGGDGSQDLGGLETDLSARILEAGGRPLPGVYAVGEAAGFGGCGLHGYRSLEGTVLGGCLLSGLTTGRALADDPVH